MTDSNRKILATLWASLMVVSMVGAAVAPTAVGAAGPSGMVALGNAQISEDVPAGESVPIGASDLEGAVYASNHADTLEVVVTTPERASDYLENGTVVTNDEVALVLRDDEVHEGRDVAIDLALLEEAVGFAPEVAYGTHDSGEEWQSAIERDGTVGTFHVPEFSSNSVTFSGGITLTGDAAGDGTSYQYELSSLDGVDNFAINATGVENTAPGSTSARASNGDTLGVDVGGTESPQNETVTLTGIEETSAGSLSPGSVSNGYSTTVDVGGNQPARDAEVTLTGNSQTDDRTVSGSTSGSTSESISVGGTEPPANGEVSFTASAPPDPYGLSSNYYLYKDRQEINIDPLLFNSPPNKINQIDFNYVRTFDSYTGGSDGASGVIVDVYLTKGDATADPLSGTKVATDVEIGTGTDVGDHTVDVSEFDTGTADQVTLGIDFKSDPNGASNPDTENVYVDDAGDVVLVQTDTSATVTDDSGSSTTTVAEGGSTTNTLDISQSTSSVDFAGDYESLDYTLSWTEESITRDPSATIGGSTVSHSGELSDGQTVTESVSLSPGSNSVDVSTSAHTVGVSSSWTEVTATEDPSVTVGGSTVSHTGILGPSETVTESVDLSTGSQSADVSVNGPVNVASSWTEVSQTRDPVVEVNGYTTEYTGTLADGEATSLATNEAWLENGTNTVTISTSSPATGPESLAGFSYQHDASGTTQSVNVEATSWTEKFNVSNTFPSAVAGADAVLTFNEDVAEINGVEYRKDGGEWTSPPGYELNGTDLEVDLGDISADTTVDVRATGYKINTYDGEIDILSPTVEGDDLSTEVEITDLTDGGMFGLRVDGTVLGDRIHYASEESWSGDPAHVDVTASGTQILRAADANVGSTMTVSSSPISVSPESGAIEVVAEDAEEPRFKIRQGDTVGASSVEVTYHDTLDGERYVLYSETESREIDADRAESPVTFTTDGDTETYTIKQVDREGSVGGGGPEKETGGSGAPLVLVVPAVGLSVGGLFFAGRRFGARGARGNAVLIGASTIVSVTALELVTSGSIISQVWRATVFALGDAAASGLGAVVAAIATIVGLWQLQQRTRADVPVWVTIPSVSLAAVLALESIRPGSVLGALEGVIAEVGALLALLAVAGIFYWWRNRNQVQKEEASTPDTEVTLDLGDQGDD